MCTATRPCATTKNSVRRFWSKSCSPAQRAYGGQLGDLPLAEWPQQVAAAQRDLCGESGSGRYHVSNTSISSSLMSRRRVEMMPASFFITW